MTPGPKPTTIVDRLVSTATAGDRRREMGLTLGQLRELVALTEEWPEHLFVSAELGEPDEELHQDEFTTLRTAVYLEIQHERDTDRWEYPDGPTEEAAGRANHPAAAGLTQYGVRTGSTGAPYSFATEDLAESEFHAQIEELARRNPEVMQRATSPLQYVRRSRVNPSEWILLEQRTQVLWEDAQTRAKL